MAAVGTRLSRILLMVRGSEGINRAVDFYHKGLGLAVVRHTDDWAELLTANHMAVNLKAVDSEAQLSTGYSPLLSFEVSDMDTVVSTCAQLGGHLDGPIQYPAHGKVAALRSPDGHMIGLYEPSV